jgi:Domain of unknown function (DUF4399)
MKSAIAAAFFALLVPAIAHAESTATPSPAGAKVFIIEPKDGAVVSSPVTVKFGIEGMEVAPAGSETPNSGHHHLIIDTEFDNTGDAIPADDNHKHFGKGQTETTVELKQGVHSLQLVLGDKNHIPHVPPVTSEVVNITVK